MSGTYGYISINGTKWQLLRLRFTVDQLTSNICVWIFLCTNNDCRVFKMYKTFKGHV
jgi:hypothetical protein